MPPSKIFLGIDGSKRPNFVIHNKFFVVAGVSCTDLKVAYSAEKKILEKFGDKKGADIYEDGDWVKLLKHLLTKDFRFHILFLDKSAISKKIAMPLQAKKYSLADSPPNYQSKATVKMYSLHTWLVVDLWSKLGFKGDAEVRVDNDFSGRAWVQNHKEITKHAKNCGFKSCDYQQARTSQYPLVRLGDYIAPFFRRELEKNGGKSKIFSLVKDKAIFYPLAIVPMPTGGLFQTLPPWAVSLFTPW